MLQKIRGRQPPDPGRLPPALCGSAALNSYTPLPSNPLPKLTERACSGRPPRACDTSYSVPLARASLGPTTRASLGPTLTAPHCALPGASRRWYWVGHGEGRATRAGHAARSFSVPVGIPPRLTPAAFPQSRARKCGVGACQTCTANLISCELSLFSRIRCFQSCGLAHRYQSTADWHIGLSCEESRP